MQVAVPAKQLPGTRYGLLVDMASLPVEITEDDGGTFGYCQFRIVRTEVHIVRSRSCRAIGRPLLHTHKSCLHITRWFFRILGQWARERRWLPHHNPLRFSSWVAASRFFQSHSSTRARCF